MAINSFCQIGSYYKHYCYLYLYLYLYRYSYHYHYLYPHQLPMKRKAVRISNTGKSMAKQLQHNEWFFGGYFIHIIHQLLLACFKPLPGGEPIFRIGMHCSEVLLPVRKIIVMLHVRVSWRKNLFYGSSW